MRFIVATFVASALAGLSNAYTQPQGPEPIGNPFKTPELNEQVPKGKAFQVTWDPTIDKAGTVTILLLHGPSTNVKPMYPIAEKIPNSGSFTWTPSESINPESTHYGLQLIVDATGQYQYTPQFGISGDAASSPSSSSPAGASTYSVSSAPAPTSYEISTSPAPAPTSYPVSSAPAESSSAATAVPPAPSSAMTSPVYITTTTQVTTCSYPNASGAPVASGSGGLPAPVPGSPAPSAGSPAPPAGSPAPPAGSVPAGASGSAGAEPSSTGIATAAAGKTVIASGMAVVAALVALVL